MAEVKWIKIVTDVFDDEKVILIESMPEADSIIVIWFKLLCLAGKQNRDGLLMLNDKIAYTDEMLATVFRRPVNTVRLALNTFEQFGMIEIVDGTICIANWEKHQNIDKLAQMREYNRLAQQKSRARRRLPSAVNDNVNDSQENVNDSQGTDIEEDKEKEEDKENSNVPQAETRTKRFTPPIVEEVKAYCAERKNNVDAQRFVDYYTSNGWLVGKNKMKDWRAAVRTWERNSTNSSKASGITVKQNASSDLDDIF
jgi:predicted phage replisome organizer